MYFDNLQVTHIRGPLLSENHYYGGNELDDDESINLYSTFFREYDPQIGRFNGVDIMSEKSFGLSVYQFALNNPVSHNDPLGNFMHTPTQFYGEYYDKYMSMNSLEHMTGIGGGLFDPNNGGGGEVE